MEQADFCAHEEIVCRLREERMARMLRHAMSTAEIATKTDGADDAEWRMRQTFKLELRRATASGVLETAATTFLLLIAVAHFQAGATAKALLVAGGPLGLLLGPIAVSVTRALGWRAATGAAACAASGAMSFLGAALIDDTRFFVACGALGVLSLTAGIPLMTQIYQENYPSSKRGRLFSLTAMARVAAASLFAWLAGWWLDGRIEEYRFLMFTFCAAALAAAWFTWRCPSSVFTDETSSNPLAGLRHVHSDRVFRWLLASWMLMGLGNLLMLPLRGLIAPFLAFWLIETWTIPSLTWWSLGLMAVASLMLAPEARTLRRRRSADPSMPKPGGLS